MLALNGFCYGPPVGQFLRFMLAYPVAAVFAVIAFVIATWGFVSDAYSLYQLGLPGWAWQLSGFALFFVAVVMVLFRMHEDKAGTSPAPPARRPMEISDEALAAASMPPRSVRSDRSMALVALERAVIAAGQSLAARREEDARRTLPIMRAAILTANKEFGLPGFEIDEAPSARAMLITLKGYIEEILPLLKLGHDAEARKSAKAYIVRLAGG